MKIFKNKLTLIKKTSGIKKLSFIPTMGGLHPGHKNLIKKGQKIGKVVVSIYVNPNQFNSKLDFKNYPRQIKKDLSFLKKLNVNYVYLPNHKDIYSFKAKNKIFLDKSSKILCGKFRKKHFKGVINVVNRFLEIIEPKYIILGKKDLQQLLLIKKHINKNHINTKIISVKTARERNGLAYSSRNINLSTKEKKIASNVYRIIKREKNNIKKNKLYKFDKDSIRRKLSKIGINKVQYIEKLNNKNLKSKINKNDKFNIFIAFYINEVRLIDNV